MPDARINRYLGQHNVPGYQVLEDMPDGRINVLYDGPDAQRATAVANNHNVLEEMNNARERRRNPRPPVARDNWHINAQGHVQQGQPLRFEMLINGEPVPPAQRMAGEAYPGPWAPEIEIDWDERPRPPQPRPEPAHINFEVNIPPNIDFEELARMIEEQIRPAAERIGEAAGDVAQEMRWLIEPNLKAQEKLALVEAATAGTLESNSNPKQEPLKKRLANTILSSRAQQHILNLVHKPGATLFQATNLWLTNLETLQEDHKDTVLSYDFEWEGTRAESKLILHVPSTNLALPLAVWPETGDLIIPEDCTVCPRSHGKPKCNSWPQRPSQAWTTGYTTLIMAPHGARVHTMRPVSFVKEMVNLNTHPAVALWLLGNESASMEGHRREAITPQAFLARRVEVKVAEVVLPQIMEALDEPNLPALLAGHPIPALAGTVRDLFRAAFSPQVAGPDAIPTKYGGRANRWGGGATVTSGDMALIATIQADNISTALGRKIRDVNWATRQPMEVIEDPANAMFDEPIANLLRRTADGMPKTLVERKARALMLATARVYGFERRSDGWYKGDLIIYDNGEINIKGRPQCVIFKGGGHGDAVATSTVGLPYGDEIAARMLAVATKMRHDINTIDHQSMLYLDTLFKERAITDRGIDQVANEILAEEERAGYALPSD